MKRVLHLLSLTALLGSSVAVGQTVETFESYNSDTEMRTKWVRSNTPPGANDEVYLGTDGGANSTAKYIWINNGGYSVAAKAQDIITPAAGSYKISYYWKNGFDATPIRSLTFKVVDGTSNVYSKLLSPASGTIPAQATWKAEESDIFELSGGPVTIEITGSDPAGTYKAGFDEIELIPIANVPLTVSVYPDERINLSRTRTIVPTIKGGSETYTQVAYDVGDNGSNDFVSVTAPFAFEWDTLGAMPQDTSGTVALKVTATDSNNDTVSIVEEFTVDNRFAGRQSMITNGDFSSFAGTGVGANLPAGWVENFPSANATYGSGPGRNTEAGNALQITFASSASEPTPEFADRYTLRTVPKTGNWQDLQTTWWGKGSACRLYYFTSEDGSTFVNTFQDAGQANDVNWTFVVEPVQSNALVNLSDTSQVSLVTHMLGSSAGPLDHFWDDITWEGILVPPTSDVEGWNLY